MTYVDLTDWNWFDWILATITVVSMVMAFRRGLVRAIVGMLGVVSGFVLATYSYEDVGDWIRKSRVTVPVIPARIIAFLLIVIVVAAAFEFLGLLLQKVLKTVGLSFVDRILGLAFGFGRGCLVGIGLLMVVASLAPSSSAVTDSTLSPYLFAVVHDVSFLVPQYLQRQMAAGVFSYKQNPSR